MCHAIVLCGGNRRCLKRAQTGVLENEFSRTLAAVTNPKAVYDLTVILYGNFHGFGSSSRRHELLSGQMAAGRWFTMTNCYSGDWILRRGPPPHLPAPLFCVSGTGVLFTDVVLEHKENHALRTKQKRGRASFEFLIDDLLDLIKHGNENPP